MTTYSYDRAASQPKVALSIGETFENDKWRVHRYADSIVITDLTNAGRRGKQVLSWVLMHVRTGESTSMEFEMLAKRGVDAARMKTAVDEAVEVGAEFFERNQKGVDIKPGNFQKLVVRGAHITITADYDDFMIQDIDDDMNEPTCIGKGKKDVYLFYRWVKDNMKALQPMTFGAAMDAAKKAGIKLHQFCAID